MVRISARYAGQRFCAFWGSRLRSKGWFRRNVPPESWKLRQSLLEIQPSRRQRLIAGR
jgi:hypothetical protein